MFGISVAAIFAIATIAGVSGQIPFVAADDGETELKAILLDINGNEVGEVKFEQEDDQTELKVELEGFTPDSVFDISIAGTSVGSIATDSNGNGEVKWEPSPVLVADGDSVSVGGLTATLDLESDDDEDDDDDDDEEDDDEDEDDE